MDKVPEAFVDQLDLELAVRTECEQQVRNLIPREPWRDPVLANASAAADLVRSWMLAGGRAAPAAVVNARKIGHGTRPVPIVGVFERVAYRAITSRILSDVEVPGRSADEYLAFVRGPLDYERSLHPTGPVSFDDFEMHYVVETDIAAFYEYVDHEVLRRELEMRTGQVSAVDLLVGLLGGIQGRSFGIPQLLDSSDALSDIYIQIVERNLIRRGLPVWRFNDDFRIACRTYQESLDNIEILENYARSVGLNISDYKTFTPTFINYLFKYGGAGVDKDAEEFDSVDVEAVVVDYSDLDKEQAVEAATETLDRFSSKPADGGIDIRDIQTDGVREVRRAFASLGFHKSSAGLAHVAEVFTFLPSLTPSLCNYLMRLADSEPQPVGEMLSELQSASRSRSEWQSLWLVSTLRSLGLMDDGARVDWVRDQRERQRLGSLGAEAALALARVGAVPFDELDEAVRVAPEPLAPWFVMGMTSLAELDPKLEGRLDAVASESPLFQILISS